MGADRTERLYDRAVLRIRALEPIASGDDAELQYRAPSISGWSVAEQLDHLAIANRLSVGRIRQALKEGPNTVPGPTLAGRLVLLIGYIPRGIGEAPEATRPGGGPVAEVRARVAEAVDALLGLRAELPTIRTARGRAGHPVLGGFTAAQWLRFIDVHTHHHLKIIRDIRNATE